MVGKVNLGSKRKEKEEKWWWCGWSVVEDEEETEEESAVMVSKDDEDAGTLQIFLFTLSGGSAFTASCVCGFDEAI